MVIHLILWLDPTDQPFYNFALEKNYIKLDSIKFNGFYYLIPFFKPNIKILILRNSLEIVSKESNQRKNLYYLF